MSVEENKALIRRMFEESFYIESFLPLTRKTAILCLSHMMVCSLHDTAL
jgi:hypothetical protein